VHELAPALVFVDFSQVAGCVNSNFIVLEHHLSKTEKTIPMIKQLLIAPLALTLILSGCANRKVNRIDPSTQTDLSGRWNDTDSRLVAEEMIKDVLDKPWRMVYEERMNRKPVVIVGSVKNKTSEHIDPITFIKDLEKAFINSGTVGVVQSGDERSQVRDERNDQQTFASEESRKQWGKERGADFMLNGVMVSIVDAYKNNKTITYQVNMELTNLETNEKVWIGGKNIKKQIKN
jgi:uncharacterized protein (TIGR02722 family)